MKEWAVVVMHWRDEFLRRLKQWEVALLLLEVGPCSPGRERLILDRSAHHWCGRYARRGWQALVGLMAVIAETMDVVLTPLVLELNEVFGFSNSVEAMPLRKWVHSIILFPREGVGGHEWGYVDVVWIAYEDSNGWMGRVNGSCRGFAPII
jgi:hypothetical protein